MDYLPNTMVDHPYTILDLPNTMVDLPNTMIDLLKTMVDLPKTWFQYRVNKQFGPFFGAEFDPNGHKNHKKYIFLKSK